MSWQAITKETSPAPGVYWTRESRAHAEKYGRAETLPYLSQWDGHDWCTFGSEETCKSRQMEFFGTEYWPVPAVGAPPE